MQQWDDKLTAAGIARNPYGCFQEYVELNEPPCSSIARAHGTQQIIILQQFGESLGLRVLHGYYLHSGKPLGAWPLTRYTTLAACCLLSCCDLRLSCLGCLLSCLGCLFVLGSCCLAGVPAWPPLGCLPIQVLGGNGGGTPFTGCCCCMNPAF